MEKDKAFLVRVVPVSDFVVDEGELLVDLVKLLIAVGLDIELHALQTLLDPLNSLVVVA